MGNIFNGQGSGLSVETLAENNAIKVQAVTARGLASEAQAFCPQEASDLLLLLKGELVLEYQNQSDKVTLGPGQHHISSRGDNNRIEATSQDEETTWLKVSFQGKNQPGKFPSPDAGGGSAQIQGLIESESVRVDRVISNGQSAAANAFCHDEVLSEVVVFLKGETVLEYETASGKEKIAYGPGDVAVIPPNTRNRVDSTSSEGTEWIAIYYAGGFNGQFSALTGY